MVKSSLKKLIKRMMRFKKILKSKILTRHALRHLPLVINAGSPYSYNIEKLTFTYFQACLLAQLYSEITLSYNHYMIAHDIIESLDEVTDGILSEIDLFKEEADYIPNDLYELSEAFSFISLAFSAAINRENDSELTDYLNNIRFTSDDMYFQNALSLDIANASKFDFNCKPLWQDENIPVNLRENFNNLRVYLLQTSPDWQIWITWYEAQLEGKQLFSESMFDRILNLTTEDWEKGAEYINSLLMKWWQETAEAEVKQKPATLQFGVDDAATISLAQPITIKENPELQSIQKTTQDLVNGMNESGSNAITTNVINRLQIASDNLGKVLSGQSMLFS